MAVLTGTPKATPLKTYTNSTWTDFVSGASGQCEGAITITNNAGVDVAGVSIRRTDIAGTVLLTLFVAQTVVAGAQVVSAINIVVEAGQKLQIFASAAGMEFEFNGAT